MSTPIIILICIVCILVLFIIVLLPLGTWFRARIAGVKIGIGKLLGMKLRKSNYKLIVECCITAKNMGINMTVDEIETHYIAGGNTKRVIEALIYARSANISLPKDAAKAIDLAGKNVLIAVKNCVIPKIVEIPAVYAVTKDGAELCLKSNMTVKTNIGRLIGGVGEEVIIKRICEGFIEAIGLAENYRDVFKNTGGISKVILNKGLDAGTAFDILAIDIIEVERYR